MIDFEHGALRRKGEPELAGMLAHGVMDHSQARAFSFLNGTALLDFHQWTAVLEAELERRRKRQNRLDRAVRRLQHLLVEHDKNSSVHQWLVSYVEEITYGVKRDFPDGCEHTYETITRILTAAMFAVLFCEEIGDAHVALLYAPFEPFIPLASLG
jgi:hypothetical protein